MEIGLLKSSNFDNDNYPLIMNACNQKGISVNEYRDLSTSQLEDIKEISHLDAIWDRSSITDDLFFRKLSYILTQKSSNALLINSPVSTMNAYNKFRTHKLLGKYSPTTIIYDGTNLDEVIKKFGTEKQVVLKDALGWQGEGVYITDGKNLANDLQNKEEILVQRYVPPSKGIGRILCLNTPFDFLILGAYARHPTKSWKTGPGSEPAFTETSINDKLYNFARNVTIESGLFINGIDYIEHNDELYMLEINSVPRLHTLHTKFGVDAAGKIVKQIMVAKNC